MNRVSEIICPTAHREGQIQIQSEGQIQNPIAKTPALAIIFYCSLWSVYCYLRTVKQKEKNNLKLFLFSFLISYKYVPQSFFPLYVL